MKLGRSSFAAFLVVGVTVIQTPTAATAATFKVVAGESIQAAVDAASAGDKVIVYPGTYTEPGPGPAAVRITKPLQLIGKLSKADRDAGLKVRIVPGAGQTDGILVEPANPGDPDVDGVKIKGMTVEGFPNNGIFLRYVQNFDLDRNESINNLENGIWPTLSANGLVRRNVAYGSLDSGLWVEASENVRVLKNVMHTNPTGIEITVSNNVEVSKNEVYNNTVGIGIYHPSAASLPPLAVMDDFIITKNYIHDNNAENTAPPGSMSGSLPPGGGVLILGTDNALVEGNTIENNNFYGIAVVGYCLAVDGTDFSCDLLPPDVEPEADRNKFKNNFLINNGTAPDLAHPLASFAADLTFVRLDADHHNNIFCGNRDPSLDGIVTLGFNGAPLYYSKC